MRMERATQAEEGGTCAALCAKKKEIKSHVGAFVGCSWVVPLQLNEDLKRNGDLDLKKAWKQLRGVEDVKNSTKKLRNYRT